MFKRTVWLLAVAALIAAAAFLLIESKKHWESPQYTVKTIYDGEIRYQGSPVHVLITCNCPPALTETQKSVLPLVVKLESAKSTPGVLQPNPGGAQRQALSPENTGQTGATPAKHVYVLVDALNASTELPDKWGSWSVGELVQLPQGISTGFLLTITPNGGGTTVVTFHFQPGIPGQQYLSDTEFGLATWQPETRPTFWAAVGPFVYSFLVFGLAFGVFFVVDRRLRNLRNRTESQLIEARNKAVNHPEEANFAWESAKIKLEAYFDRNLIQVNLVFWVAVLVMAVGFSFVLAGVVLSLRDAEHFPTAKLAALSGIITQFIGATFMVIYRSTMGQANEFMTILERINTVGMAVHELDRIPDTKSEMKDKVRAQVVELLLGSNQSTHAADKRKKDVSSGQ